MPKIVNTALKAKAKAKAWTFKAKAKAIKFGLEAPRGQGLASRTTSLALADVCGLGVLLRVVYSNILLNLTPVKSEYTRQLHSSTVQPKQGRKG